MIPVLVVTREVESSSSQVLSVHSHSEHLEVNTPTHDTIQGENIHNTFAQFLVLKIRMGSYSYSYTSSSSFSRSSSQDRSIRASSQVEIANVVYG